ncbi:PREDICTED: F-box/LRR-repeat protein 14-like [Nelumbo nucifera]|uniref:F-box/LRR-repeat protein 14 n=2 Tax=Nelumbo nucifera TaxID=4432 RepID=A0A822Y4D6_NELNU|nr:PREDICTED: F-box/LRR-repeat protein 14-like [Nelumbo nucifera]DAD27307.1 TPA_asm: hypothetical protein HUJ06_028775 [Nelumbo nucifera]
MEDLPEHLVYEILGRLKKTADRNSTSLACKRLHNIDREQRELLRVGCGLHPGPAFEALISLCNRFPNLRKVEINYSSWCSQFGIQLSNQGLLILSQHCPSLVDLTLSHCNSINDFGLRYLSCCTKLTALRLESTERITARGLFFVVARCKNLITLHLTECSNVTGIKWLEYLGMVGTLEDLSIKFCNAIEEEDLAKLGAAWEKLKRLQFVANLYSIYRAQSPDLQKNLQWVSCENMVELSLTYCIVHPGRGLSCLLGRCRALEKLDLQICLGVGDSDIVSLAQKSNNLRSITLHLPLKPPYYMPNTALMHLTDESLKALAQNCPMLESVEISFTRQWKCPSSSLFSLSGILTLIQTCPLRVLILDNVYMFDDDGMKALCSAHFLETLELVRCQEISDEGLQFVGQIPHLRFLKIVRCLHVTDNGLKPLVGSHKLGMLTVEECPCISQQGVQGAARSVSYKGDPKNTWMSLLGPCSFSFI